jgi:hypothetical protein
MSSPYRKELPRSAEPLQFVLPALVELNAGPSHEVDDGA